MEVSCYLGSDLYTEEFTESHPSWNIIESDQYILAFRKIKCYTRVFQCNHGERSHSYRWEEPDIDACTILDTWLDSPVECLTTILQDQGLSTLSEFDVQRLAAFLVGLRDQVRPGTKVVAVAEVIIYQVERVFDLCVLTVPINPVEHVELAADEIITVPFAEAAELGMEIADLPRMKYDGSGDDTCSICLDKFSKDDEFTRTPCSHNFHFDCLGAWMRKRSTCPLCRTNIQNLLA